MSAGPAILHPLADSRWLAFVQTVPGATIFHHPAWLELVHARYGYPIAACCVLDARGSIAAGAPVALVRSPLSGRRLVAFPFSDACPPLGAPHDLVALGAALDDLRQGMGLSLELRGPLPAAPGAREGARYFRHVVPLAADVGDVERRFRRSSVLRGLRRARREGLVAQRRSDRDALDAFFRLHLATRSRLGAPTQPRGFIRALERLFAQELGFVLLVARGAEVAAAAVFLHHAGTLTYKYGASDAGALPLRPNNLLFWEAIRWGCERGMQRLDLGRTDLGQESLRAFKLAWGGEEEQLVYTHLGTDAPRAADRGVAGRALAAGLRHAPPLASRLVGEALYRHAG
ncbi:MAG TPA: GNAT family N-acetyltransferase [Baekduia sp.]|nr:GNAT family N-acetyltransferase [Baekduia sp.]